MQQGNAFLNIIMGVVKHHPAASMQWLTVKWLREFFDVEWMPWTLR